MNDIIYIDDTVTKDSPDGKKVKNIVGSKKYSLTFINKKADIDELLASDLNMLKLVLLDLDLSKMKADAESILKALVKKKVKVIILSGLPKTSDVRKKKGCSVYQQALPDMSRLYNKGALAYIYKEELDDREDFVANIINNTITDQGNSQYTLLVNDHLPSFQIIDNEGNSIAEKKVKVTAKWKSNLEYSTTAWDVVMRILFEMGKTNVTEIAINNVYDQSLHDIRSKKDGLKLMPSDFHKILGVLNNDIRDKADGRIVGRLLQGGGHGDGSGIYRANIGRVDLKNRKGEPVEPNWKETIEKRLAYLESELNSIKKKLPSK